MSSTGGGEECANQPGGIDGDAMSGGAPISLESAPPHQDDVGIVGAFPLRAVSGGAHGLTDCNVKQHAGLESRKGGERGR